MQLTLAPTTIGRSNTSGSAKGGGKGGAKDGKPRLTAFQSLLVYMRYGSYWLVLCNFVSFLFVHTSRQMADFWVGVNVGGCGTAEARVGHACMCSVGMGRMWAWRHWGTCGMGGCRGAARARQAGRGHAVWTLP